MTWYEIFITRSFTINLLQNSMFLLLYQRFILFLIKSRGSCGAGRTSRRAKKQNKTSWGFHDLHAYRIRSPWTLEAHDRSWYTLTSHERPAKRFTPSSLRFFLPRETQVDGETERTSAYRSSTRHPLYSGVTTIITRSISRIWNIPL